MQKTSVNRAPYQAACRLCGEQSLQKVRSGVARVTTEDFQITDSRYGTTLDLFHCAQCKLMQCPTDGVLSFYEDLEDRPYEESREPRRLQADQLVKSLGRGRGRLLDVGAGTGILVEAAQAGGFEASGIEPSRWASNRAKERGFPVACGTMDDIQDTFDVITLVDVIEHVDDPKTMVQQVYERLNPNGIALVVTPDLASLAARILRFRWWHFRIAHITYFNRKTLERLVTDAGFRICRRYRPAWYFRGDYLFERLARYVPFLKHIPLPSFLKTMTVPLNLFDSWAFVIERPS